MIIPRRLSIITPSSRQVPFLEFSEHDQRWRVWQSFTSDVRSGTYLDLYPSGHIDRVTLAPDGSVQTITLMTRNIPDEHK